MTTAETPTYDEPKSSQITLQTQVAVIGTRLAERVNRLLAAVPGAPTGPVGLARAIGIDKVLASRVLRAAGSKDPVAVLQSIPGPEPMRRLASAAGRKGVSAALVAELHQAVDEFDDLIRSEAGDRSALDAILASWLPEARAEFELRRKQAAFRALSQLRGQMAGTFLSAAFMHPSPDGESIDIVWIVALLRLQRLRPGTTVKFATRRVSAPGGTPRRPTTLDGRSVEGFDGLRLDEFSSQPPPRLHVQSVGEVTHYLWADEGFGPRHAADLVFAEVNRAEIARYVASGSRRKRYVFAEITTPAELLVFDAIVHESLLTGAVSVAPGGSVEPSLHIYDTSFEGVANVNDRARDIDRLDLVEQIQPLGRGVEKFRVAEVPWYPQLLRQVCRQMGWDEAALRGYRARIDYPLYGSQVAIAFPAEERGA
jgi:hypothetical protein